MASKVVINKGGNENGEVGEKRSGKFGGLH